MERNRHWVGTWTTSPAPSEAGVGFNNHTLRLYPRVSIGGDTLRVRVSNAYGNGKLAIGAAYGRPTTAATGCTRAISAIVGWATPSAWRCSIKR